MRQNSATHFDSGPQPLFLVEPERKWNESKEIENYIKTDLHGADLWG